MQNDIIVLQQMYLLSIKRTCYMLFTFILPFDFESFYETHYFRTRTLYTMSALSKLRYPTKLKIGNVGLWWLWCGNMGSEVEEHITKKYDIKKRLGKGVRKLFYCTMVITFKNVWVLIASSVFFQCAFPRLLTCFANEKTKSCITDYVLVLDILV